MNQESEDKSMKPSVHPQCDILQHELWNQTPSVQTRLVLFTSPTALGKSLKFCAFVSPSIEWASQG